MKLKNPKTYHEISLCHSSIFIIIYLIPKNQAFDMSNKQQLKLEFERLEKNTVSDSFGAPSSGSKAPIFNFLPLIDVISESPQNYGDRVYNSIQTILKNGYKDHLNYILRSTVRFAFCIELTNLEISSTKNKTRWVPGKIVKIKPDSFQNYQGTFDPNSDQRSSTFEECFELFEVALETLSQSQNHLKIMCALKKSSCRSVPYEGVFTYIDYSAPRVHLSRNFKLVEITDIDWLVLARPLVYPVLKTNESGSNTKVAEKIKTKVFKTDRSQTGEVQTNRAKRWECLSVDFQHASLEECWSVERKLLTGICNFKGFPEKTKVNLLRNELLYNQEVTRCPVTLKELEFSELLNGSKHGESKFQVGHIKPLKSGGRHCGESIAWISDHGNRIQGSLSLEQTQEMLKDIFRRMSLH